MIRFTLAVLIFVFGASTLYAGDSGSYHRKEFNEAIISGKLKYEDWTADPVVVSLKFLGPFEGLKQTIERINPSSEASDSTQVIIITNEGLLDDSVYAQRYEFTLKKFNNRWIIYSAEKVQVKCWPGRGHTEFSVEPCS